MTEYDTEFTEFPTCPHCGEADQDWWDGLPSKEDGDEWTVECGFCDESYTVTMSVSTYFATRKREGV